MAITYIWINTRGLPPFHLHTAVIRHLPQDFRINGLLTNYTYINVKGLIIMVELTFFTQTLHT
jgi:hypothetical protein